MEWQPIETAPHEDRVMIVVADYAESWPAFWHDGKDNYWVKEGWYDAIDYGNLLIATPSNPTHWMPLPTPPHMNT